MLKSSQNFSGSSRNLLRGSSTLACSSSSSIV